MYLLFAGPWYYPSGGWDDFVAKSEDLITLKAQAQNLQNEPEWWHIVNLTTGDDVYRWDKGRGLKRYGEATVEVNDERKWKPASEVPEDCLVEAAIVGERSVGEIRVMKYIEKYWRFENGEECPFMSLPSHWRPLKVEQGTYHDT